VASTLGQADLPFPQLRCSRKPPHFLFLKTLPKNPKITRTSDSKCIVTAKCRSARMAVALDALTQRADWLGGYPAGRCQTQWVNERG
ncbi:MAG: hypothetical protein EAZ36_07060, partial [Verrucomicrobia bacterium]